MKLTKVLLSFLLVLTMLSVNMDVVQADNEDSSDIAKKYESTLLPEQEKIKNPKNTHISLPKRGASLPTNYSSVDKGYVTDVKNQGEYGVCWAFAACSAAETSLIKKGKASKNDIDLSESHLSYYFYHTYPDDYGNTKGDRTTASGTFYDNGGNHVTTVHAIDNFGFAKESAYPYSQIKTISQSASQKSQYDTSYILKNAYSINSSYRSSMKEAIQNYGSVVAMYFSDSKYYVDLNDHTSYYNPKNIESTNHAITIVGWDDNYSKKNFSNDTSAQPQHNGAWLVKNSWGQGFGEDGYFWMSYDEVSLCNIYAYECDVKNSNAIYQYDGSASPYFNQYSQNQITIANVYSVKNTNTSKAQQLDSVSFGTDTSKVTYTIKIYGHLTNMSNPTSGVLLTTQTGKTTYEGMYNVKLNNKVYLGNASNYSIVITLKSQTNDISYLIDMSADFDWIKFTNNTSQEYSFIKNDRTNKWTKLDGSTARIKGYASMNNTKTNIYGRTFSTLSACTYTGSPLKPNVMIKDNGKLLVKDTDYKVTYFHNTQAGTGYAVVTGINNYSGTKRLSFQIKKATYKPTVKAYNGTYDGQSHTITMSGVKSGSTIKYRTSTKSAWSTKKPTRTNAGTTTVYYQITNPNYNTITGSQKITIAKRNISTLTYSKLANKVYTGKQIKQAPTVKYGSQTLKNGTDYTLTYGTNKSTGKATVKIVGKGNYTGNITKIFYIVPQKVTLSSVRSPSKKKVTVKYKKVTGASGYQIAYQKKGTNKWTYVTVSNKTSSKTLTKLTRKKNYVIKVRAYKTVGKTKYYGAYSTAKTVKVK